jgi:hypothetical protein
MSHFVGDPMQLGKLRDGALDGLRIDKIGEPLAVSSVMQSRRPAAQ